MKLMKKIISCIIVACIVVSELPITALAQTESSVIDSGSCGDNLRWSLSDTTLTISGTGKMNDYWTSSVVSWSRYCSNITNVIIEDGATSIGSYAFYECPNLTNIIIPDSVIIIGSNAFNACSSLSCVNIPNNVIEIGDYAFYECSSLTEIIIPSKITIIENGVFSRCDNLVSVTLPDGLCSIESGAFEYCDKLFYINIPDSVTSIGYAAFQGCNNLTNITIPEGVTRIGGNTFQWCNLANIVIPDSVTYIGDRAFWECTNLNNITIPNSVTHIDEFAFYDCRKVTSIIVPNGITAIEKGTFQSCDNLSSIAIPESVSEIRWGAFDGCDNLRDVYYSGSKDQWKMISIQDGNTDLLSAVIHYGENAIPDNTSMSTENSTHAVTSNTSWNQLYYDFIVSDKQTSDFALYGDWQDAVDYEVIYLNSDEIPELWITYVVAATGVESRLLSYSNGQISNEMLGNVQLNYEKYNAVIDAQHMGGGFWSNTIYRLGTDGLTKIAYGSYDYFDQNGNFTTDLTYKWDNSVITEDQYNINLSKWVNPSTAISTKSADSVIYDYPSILDYLSSVVVEDDNISFDETPSVIPEVEIQARNEWINKHIEYANSDQYKTQVVQGFSGALDDALADIKDNGMITAYNTLDAINTILDFDLDLTDEQEYEILLAQILFSRTGTSSINEIYDEYLSNNIVTICEILVENIPEMTSSEINEKVEKLKELLNTIKRLSRGDTQYDGVLSQIMDSISSFDDLNFGKEFIEAFDKVGLSFAADFLVSEIDTVENTLSNVIIYMAAGEAYYNTSDAFGDMILALRKHIAIPSDNPIFEPYQSDKLLVNDQMIWTKLNLKNAGNSIGPDPLNTPIYLSALAKAIENYYTQLESAKAGNASVIAQNAMAEFATESADNLIDAELNVVVSLFECLPVVKQFSAIKALFDGTQFVIDTFTGIDNRSYLGTMVMRLYGIAYIHYLSVDNLATHTDAWGTITTFSPIEQKFDANAQFADAAQFDEAVAVYRAILSVATDYAEEYYTTYYQAANSILSKYPNYKPTIPPYVDTDSDTFKSVKQKIIELQIQKNDLAYAWCHSSKIIFNQLYGVNTYDSSEMLIYSFKCPVSVTFKNEFGEIIATLSNGNSTVSAGYEQYFFTSEVINGSGEYVKIAAVPKSYEVVIEGTGIGRMDVSMSDYTDGQLGETKQYLGIPINEGSRGRIITEQGTAQDASLVVDGETYAEGDYNNIKHGSESKSKIIWVIGIALFLFGIALVVAKAKGKKKYIPKYLQ